MNPLNKLLPSDGFGFYGLTPKREVWGCWLLPKSVFIGAYELALLSPPNRPVDLFLSFPNKPGVAFYSPKREGPADDLAPNRDV